MLAMAALAQTQVGGAIDSDTLWQAASGPYLVTSNLVVQNGATLTIEAGTTVYMHAGVGFTISAGALRAIGTAASPIVITAAGDTPQGTPAPGSWGPLLFQDNTNDAATILEHAKIRYGNGIHIEAASPTLNRLTIEHHAGPAIALDLKSSPTGTGLVAIGNTLNGIRVPAGDMTDAIQWRLKGIPYVVAEGEISVGTKPTISGITPTSIQAGRATDAVVQGSRLTGAEGIRFDVPGISATINNGASATTIPITITLPADQALGKAPFAIQTAAGLVRFDNGIDIIATKPTIGIAGIEPSFLRRGESKSIQLTGTSLLGAQIITPSGAGLSLSNLQTTESQASFTLAAVSSATLGQQVLTVTNPALANSATATITVYPVLPKVSTNPAQLSAPPDSQPRTFQLLLSNADTVAHTVNLSMYDATIATVSPPTITIPAGTTQVQASITGIKLGTTQLNITSPTLADVNVQTYITNALTDAPVGPVMSSVIGVDRSLATAALPSGSNVGPIVSTTVGVERPLGTSALPAGSNVGPIVSGIVGINRSLDNANLLEGASVGPMLSPIVGVER